MSETVVPLTDTAMGEAPSSDGTADANGIVKVSTLGSAGLKSLIGRRIDGEDIVKMSRRMKGAVRDEFIGYLEILSKNGQMYCRCAKRADIVTATDGMITMVGTDCLTATSPCCFVLGKLGQQPPLLVTKSDAKAVIASGQSKSGVQPSTSSTQTKINTGKKPSVPASKPPQKKPAKLTIDRSAGLLTKSGLYVTITDSSSRSNVASEMTAKKPTMKSRKGTPAPALMPSSTASSSASISHSSHLDFPASVASLDPLASANFTDMSLFNTPIDPNSFNLLQMLDPNFFDTSIDQLLASQQLPSTSIDPQVINDIMFDLSEFFSDPNMLSGLDPANSNVTSVVSVIMPFVRAREIPRKFAT
ncbi:hypothetical protein BC830DRAFT_1174554 [Chytriomyces sp. MP71]|nr:hypothetical protein BC830DRAFT_1174554 [Chytriomyces sp. MP71]